MKGRRWKSSPGNRFNDDMSEKEINKTPRHLAVLCLVNWDRERQAIQPHIEAMIHSAPLAAGDRHLAVMMVQGVLRQLQYLDSIISRFARHPLAKMKPLTLMTLRVGAYQLLFLDRVPDSAAVNETVKVLKVERQPKWIVSFVNAILRNISRQKKELPGPEKAGRNATAVLNHPDWLINRWQGRYGIEKTEKICFRNNREPLLVLRVNTLLSDTEGLTQLFREAGLEVHGGRYAPDALIVNSPAGPVSKLPGYDEGLFHVQDEAAQLVTELLGPFAERGLYLDACAGLGGKTCQLAQMVPAGAQLFAVEPNGHRFRMLWENLQRLGLEKRTRIFQGRVEELGERGTERFHGILVDAPCSGTGVIRRHPDIRWNRRLQDLRAYRRQQLAILGKAVHLLLPGGVLVYATCSMEPEENEQVIEEFLSGNPELTVSNARHFLPGKAAELVNSAGYFSSTPVDGLDGFFGARLVLGEK
ncbi:MAG TPA: 16S rRNA (cytosine(967)-C(5))-methyltransferase RsmB [Desulfobacteraceae bacterium]|nr:16S rRNA (cytosine(967)-C(5))-methyltransferase RsmB [Desulfobacteraceae bacterium]